MKWRIYLLREQGRRRKALDVRNGPFSEGALSILAIASADKPAYRMASLTNNDGDRKELLPPLYEPHLASLAGEVLVLRGFEQCDGYRGSFSVLQEWRCEALWKIHSMAP
jgi:hypothetical protein